MRWFTRLRLMLSDFFHRDRFEREVDDELQAFLALDAEARERAGASPADARRAALVQLGGVEQTKERVRDLRAGVWIDAMLQDLRFGLRLLRRQPAFAIATIAVIALGTGPLTTVVSLANSLFMRPVPGVRDTGDLVQIEFITRGQRGYSPASMSYANHADLIRTLQSFRGLSGGTFPAVSVAAPGSDARRLPAGFVMHDYFDLLGVPLVAGRMFTREEDREPGGAFVTILSYRLSRTLFGEASSALHRTIHVNGLPVTVIGVVSPAFEGIRPGDRTDVWLTGATHAPINHFDRQFWDRGRTNGLFNTFIGRLAPGVAFDQARAELTAATRALAQAYPKENQKFSTADVLMAPRPGLPIMERPRASTFVALLAGVAALLSLIAAANVANLLLFRGVRRRDEIAIRQALGASRGRLVRAHLVDAAVLALLGGGVGLVLAYWTGRLIEGAVVPGMGELQLPFDWRVIAAALAAALLMGVAFGAAPAILSSSQHDLANALRRATGSRTRRGRRLRNGLTALQLAVSLSLLVGALLLLVTMRHLRGVDAGFDPRDVTTVSIDLRSHGYDEARALSFHQTLLDRLQAQPAFDVVSIARVVPHAGVTNNDRVQKAADDPASVAPVAFNPIAPDYFATLGIPLVRGRTFTSAEAFQTSRGGCGPVIVSRALAVSLFRSIDAVGRTVTLAKSAANPQMDCDVVGVVEDVRWSSPSGDVVPMLYRPLAYDPFGVSRAVIYMIRSAQPAAQVTAAVRAAAAALDPSVPLYLDRTMTDFLEQRMAQQAIISRMLTLLAALGFLMAAVGLHGLFAESVAERTREFGIRMAVGADRRTILGVVFRHATRIAAIGVAVGLLLSAALSRALGAQLFGVSALDPAIYAGAALVLSLVVMGACLTPAIAATRVNPVETLKAE